MNLHAIYLSILGVVTAIAIAGAMAWHHSAVVEGVAKQQAADTVAKTKHDADVANQRVQDQKDSDDAVSKLKLQIADLRQQLAAQPVAVPTRLRVAAPLSGDAGRATSGVSNRTQSAATTGAAAAVSGLREGSGDGAELWTRVRILAAAGSVLAIYQQRCADWAVKQSQPLTK